MTNQAAGWYERTSDEEPLHSALGHYNSARAAVEHLDFDTAQTEIEAALQLVPEMPEAMNAKASMLSLQGRWKAGRETLLRCVTIAPKYSKGWANLGGAEAYTFDFRNARRSAERAISLCPDYSEGWRTLGFVEEQQGNMEAAIAKYTRAVELAPDSAVAYTSRAIVQCEMNHREAADDDINIAFRNAKNARDRMDCFKSRGAILQARKEYAPAMEAYAQALALRPDDPWLISTMGFVMAYRNDDLEITTTEACREAIVRFDQAIEFKPDEPLIADCFYWRAGARNQIADRLQQVAMEMKADQDNSTRDNIASATAAELSLAVADYRKALSYFEDRRGDEETARHCLQQLACIATWMTDVDDADIWSNRLLSRFPDDKYALDVRAWVERNRKGS